MSDKTLIELVDLTETLYRAEQARMATLVKEENRLRGALRQLDQSCEDAAALPTEELQPLRQIGADVLWNGWISRNKTELNRQLALCLAEKARLMKSLRHAYGKQIAAKSLLKTSEATRHKSQISHQVAEDQSLAMLHHRKR